MTDHNDGSQTEPRTPLNVAAEAVRHAAADIAATERNAEGLLLDGFAVIAKGVRLLDGEGTHDDPATRHLAPAHLWHSDAARRSDRAALLRSLACVLEDDVPPTPDDLAGCVPEAWLSRIVADAMKDTMFRRVAAIGLGPSDLRTLRAHQDLALRRGSVGLFLARMRTLGRVAARMFDARPDSDTGTSSK
jgi:hypothetical protein